MKVDHRDRLWTEEQLDALGWGLALFCTGIGVWCYASMSFHWFLASQAYLVFKTGKSWYRLLTRK